MEHKFEYDGIPVVMHSPTVGDRITRRILIQKLRRALGYEPGQRMPDDLAEGVFEYADIMSKTSSPGSAWWKAAGESQDEVRAGYECYVSMDAELFDALSVAEDATTPEKKMTQSGSKK